VAEGVDLDDELQPSPSCSRVSICRSKITSQARQLERSRTSRAGARTAGDLLL
jgi:hypothetical protein